MTIQKVAHVLNKYIPAEQPEKWDNTGILIDSGTTCNKVMLTIDITSDVITECLQKQISHIVAYHPTIFEPIKKISYDDIVYKLIHNSINVYVPHTSWDVWINKYIYKLYNRYNFMDNKGKNDLTIETILSMTKKLFRSQYVRVAKACDVSHVHENMVVGIGSAFKYHQYKDAIILTGEMSHHVLLHSVKNNNTVILLEHSNSERIAIQEVIRMLREHDIEYEFIASCEDRDPIMIM